ncbi:hypothetical protein EDD11_009884 [Mortierella claussenii]|nr:hypothetical protein EDD11_009884 [Mortierella claussenii]
MTQDQDIRGIGPYQVDESIWLTPVYRSDTAELCRVLNINRCISEGLYSPKMVFPFPEAEAFSFTERHQQKRLKGRVVTSWAIRTQGDGPIIGLFALDPFDHGNLGPCTGDGGQELKCGGLGYWISPEYAGQGIMTRVVQYGVRRMARDVFGFERVHGEAWVENQASRVVMERAGMMYSEGEPCYVAKFDEVKQVAFYTVDT